jgi:hypothetical protein
MDANLYDALEMTALAYGGIGRGNLTREGGAPSCFYGHVGFLAGAYYCSPGTDPIWDLARDTGIDAYRDNDRVVPPGRRLSWREFCRRLHIVRGPHPYHRKRRKSR